VRRIPPTIASQHPDNAFAPYWDKAGRPFISAYQEIGEAVACFQDLGVSEYMWDWEGKHADAAAIDRLFSEHYDYFSKHRLGRDKFLTFRIPNIWKEKGYNLLQAMTVILSSEDFARDLKFRSRPLFEVILPMTERADQVMHMQKLFQKLARFKANDFAPDQPANTDYLELIPLVEGVESQLGVAELLADYVKLHKQHFGRTPSYIRAFLACSDSSLSSGFLAGILGNKLGICRLHAFAKQTGIPVFPFLGAGSLRFRGGLAPDTIDRFITEFPGVRTVTVQSAFRYDHSLKEVKAAIKRLEKELPVSKPRAIDRASQNALTAIIRHSAELYKNTLGGLIPDMEAVFKAVPKRRDRRQHIGLLAYARSMGQQSLPRAITFTGGFYSIGVPPEFIGFGRTLRSLKPADLQLLKREYPNLTNDIEAAGRYLNADNLRALAKRGKAWGQVAEDVHAAQAILDVEFGPRTADEKAHHKLAAAALALRDDQAILPDLISKMAGLRKSIG